MYDYLMHVTYNVTFKFDFQEIGSEGLNWLKAGSVVGFCELGKEAWSP
jgi:hypothetical protein